jgi:threonylcarbamoyladenosine tRNA methylthiotransferase MtaB
MPGFHIENFGCRAARADGEAVSDRLRAEGLLDASHAAAEVVVVNTCSVTAEADRAARAFIRRTHRKNPAAQIVVTGCYAQRAPEELAVIPGVRAVVGNSHKALAPGLIAELAFGNSRAITTQSEEQNLIPIHSLLCGNKVAILADDRFAHSFLEEALVLPHTAQPHTTGQSGNKSQQQTRPNLKIQEGCDNRCTFCVIPQTRGSSRSLSAEAVLRQIDGFVSAGGNELVLSGINLGRWGRDLPRTNEITSLTALVRHILTRTELPRLRLSSIEPMDWSDQLIALIGEHAPRIARHAHLPLQSGSDSVLRRMHRRYRPWHYRAKVEALMKTVGPLLTLGADVMAGFPGETDAEFEETLTLIRELPFGYLHLFPFSPRPGTPGWGLHLASPVPQAVVDERMSTLRDLAVEKSLAHRRSFVGHALAAITLATDAKLAEQKKTTAISENFIPIEIKGQFPANELLQVHVKSVDTEGNLHGEVPAS